MLDKLKPFLGLDEAETTQPLPPVNTLITVKALQDENRELKEIIKKQRTLLQELSEENIVLGRERRRYADTVATQKRLIDVYESQASQEGTMSKLRQRETLVWQRATAGEKEKLLDTGLVDRVGYIRLVRELGRKYAAQEVQYGRYLSMV